MLRPPNQDLVFDLTKHKPELKEINLKNKFNRLFGMFE
jgi:hypothetical protein